MVLQEVHLNCSICTEPYSTNVSSTDLEERKHLPVLSSSKTCSHYFCQGCLEIQQQKIAEDNRGVVPKWLKCMICQTKTAFCPQEPKYYRTLIEIIELWKKADEASEKIVTKDCDSAPVNDAVDSTSHSKEKKQNDKNCAQDIELEYVHEEQSHICNQEYEPVINNRSSGSKRNRIDNGKDESETASKQNRTSPNGEKNPLGISLDNDDDGYWESVASISRASLIQKYSMHIDPSRLQKQSKKANDAWIDIISTGKRNLFRLRTFNKDSARLYKSSDPYGRACSFHNIEKGYIMSSSRVFPDALIEKSAVDVLDAERESMKYLNNPQQEIEAACRNSHRFIAEKNKKTFNHYIPCYLRFSGIGENSMKEGDIVVILVNGPTKKGQAFFGILQSSKLLLRSPAMALKEGFPCPRLFTHHKDNKFNGLMMREVKWMRRGMVRELPQQKVSQKGSQVTWLAESGPNWFCQIHNAKMWRDILSSDAFLSSTISMQ